MLPMRKLSILCFWCSNSCSAGSSIMAPCSCNALLTVITHNCNLPFCQRAHGGLAQFNLTTALQSRSVLGMLTWGQSVNLMTELGMLTWGQSVNFMTESGYEPRSLGPGSVLYNYNIVQRLGTHSSLFLAFLLSFPQSPWPWLRVTCKWSWQWTQKDSWRTWTQISRLPGSLPTKASSVTFTPGIE